jgi:hypothetical protein
LLPGGVFLLVALIELLRDRRWPAQLGWLLAAATVALTVANVHTLASRTDAAAVEPKLTRIELGALTFAHEAGFVDPSFLLDPLDRNDNHDLQAGKYFAAVRRWGSPAAGGHDIARATQPLKGSADQVFARARKLRLEPVATAAVFAETATSVSSGGHYLDRAGCHLLGPAKTRAATLEEIVPPSGTLLRVDAGRAVVALRRWAEGFAVNLGSISDRRWHRLVIGRDSSRIPWHLQVRATGRAHVCLVSSQGRARRVGR